MKRLPKGLQEFAATLNRLEYTRELLERLTCLPASNFAADLARFDEAMKLADEAEKVAALRRQDARNVAQRIWQAALKNWSVAELEEASGYKDE